MADANRISRARFDSLLAWYFVVVWGSGYIATKIGLQYAAPFTFLCLRYAFGLICLTALIIALRPRWPSSPSELGHLAVAGLLMHAINLSGSHYAQYLGLSAGVTALVLALQPLLTAALAARREPPSARQWAGIATGLAGIALVVRHKIDLQAVQWNSLAAVAVSLLAVTFGTLYQRRYCVSVDLRTGGLIQFAVSLLVLAPLAWKIEGMSVDWTVRLLVSVAFLVIFASILAVNALHTLMRHGAAARVTSLLYLTPLVAVVLEFVFFGETPDSVTLLGFAVTCLAVAMVNWKAARRAEEGLKK